MKRIILFLILTAAVIPAQQWEITSIEPSFITEFAVDKNGDIYGGGAPGEFYRYSAQDSAWQTINNINLEHRILHINNAGDLLAFPTGEDLETRILKSTDKGNSWIDNPTPSSSIGYMYGDTLFGYNGCFSIDGGQTWDSIGLGNKGRFYLTKSRIFYFELDGTLQNYDYYQVDLTNKKIIPLGRTVYKRDAIYNTEYVNTNVPDSIELPLELYSAYPAPYYTFDSEGNLIVYSGTNSICRYIDDKWEIINYDPKNSADLPYFKRLCENYAIADSAIYRVNYDSTFFLIKLPGKHITGMRTDTYCEAKFINNSIYLKGYGDSGKYGNWTFIKYDLIEKNFISFRKGIPGQYLSDIQTNSDGMFAQLKSGDMYKSTDGGEKWTEFPTQTHYNFIALDSVIIISGNASDATASYDGGKSWKDLYISIEAINSDGQNIVCSYTPIYGGRLSFSTNYGRTWQNTNVIESPIKYVYTANGKYMGSAWNSVYIADENLILDTTYTPAEVTKLSSIDGTFFGATNSGIVKFAPAQASGNRLFKSADNPEWVFTGLEGKKVYTLTTDTAKVIYAGAEDGTYFSADTGRTWEVYGTVVSGNLKKTSTSGLSNVKALLANGSELFAAASEGLYKTKTYNSIGIEEEPNINVTDYKLAQNYPNPFNPVTNISFSLPKAANVKLTVYNALGQQVEELVNMELGQGSYSYRFDGSKLASGVYIYSLVAGQFRTAKKMMLIK